MSNGYSPKLPLTVDPVDGFYKLNKTYKEFLSQNLKHMLLTIPGERVMEPDFGVGLKQYLFEQAPYDTIQARLESQVAKYMPFIEIRRLEFSPFHPGGISTDRTGIQIQVEFFIRPLDSVEIVEITQFLD